MNNKTINAFEGSVSLASKYVVATPQTAHWAVWLYYKIRKDHGFCPYLIIKNPSEIEIALELGVKIDNIAESYVEIETTFVVDTASSSPAEYAGKRVFPVRLNPSYGKKDIALRLVGELADYGDVVLGYAVEPITGITQWIRNELNELVPKKVSHLRWDEVAC